MMPIVTKLKNGDIVSIITSDIPKGPSRDWLKFIKSSTAKTRIQQWFKKEQREENIVKGKELLEKEIKRIGMNHVDLFKTEYINSALNRYKYNSIDDMNAAVGFGAISPTKIIARMLEEYKKEHKEEAIEEKLEELSKAKKPNKVSKTGVIVKGIDNCLVKLSKCCNPVPGDNIIGYITKGRGVSVHTTECVNIKELLEQEDRIIDVEWAGEEKTASYTVDIEVFANDRDGLLADIIKIIGDTKTKLIAVNAKANKERIVLIELTVEVQNLEALNKTLKAIRKVDSVYEVKRKK